MLLNNCSEKLCSDRSFEFPFGAVGCFVLNSTEVYSWFGVFVSLGKPELESAKEE